MARRYVSDLIGEAYRDWKAGDSVLITTSTGSGKTTFVLNKLLRHARQLGKHVVYYCNRKFLNLQLQEIVRAQLIEPLGDEGAELASYFHIRTYQHAEHYHEYPDLRAFDEEGKMIPHTYEIMHQDVLYYIYDEAMYFVQDSAFNSATRFWYQNCKEIIYSPAISVFLTATPEPLLLFLNIPRIHRERFEEAFAELWARKCILSGNNPEKWIRYLSNRYQWLCDAPIDYYTETPFERQQAINAEYDRVLASCEAPFQDLFAWVRNAYASRVQYVYAEERSLQERYSYVDEYYFDELISLAEQIVQSVREGEKWLIFVRTREEGKSLQDVLKYMDCDSTLIFAEFTRGYDGRPVKRRSQQKRVFDALVREKRQDCSVLIASSVLDCGISIEESVYSEQVRNIVICQPDKTSFLQMLGRVRITAGQRLRLFIQAYTARQIKGYVDQYYREFWFLVHFLLSRYEVPRTSFGYQDEESVYRRYGNSLLSPIVKGEKKLMKELENQSGRMKYLFYKVRNDAGSSVKNLAVNELAVINYLSAIYFAEVELKKWQREDTYYYLREQLSWIGREYDSRRWVDYETRRRDLWNYLEHLAQSGRWLNKDEQIEFRRECLIKISKLKDRMEYFKKTRHRYSTGTGKYPGKKALETMFDEAGMPFRIESKQMKSSIISFEEEKVLGVDRAMFWKIKKIETTEMAYSEGSTPMVMD